MVKGITDSDQSDEVSIKEVFETIKSWWSFLLSKWILISVASAFGMILGLAYSFTRKPVYTAELSFALQDERSGGGGMMGAMGFASQLGIDLGGNVGGQFSGDNLLELMKSRTMVEKALLSTVSLNGKKLTLVDYYINFNNFRSNWSNDKDLKDLHFLPNEDRLGFNFKKDSLLGAFHKNLIKKNLSVNKLDKKLSIISLKVSSTNELFSKYFAEALATVVSDFYIQTKTKREVQNVYILKHQVDSVRNSLNAAISGVASSFDAAPNANPLLSSLRVPSQRKQVEVTANTAILTELIKNLEAARMSLLQETPLIQIIDRPILPLEINKVGKLTSIIFGGIIFTFLMIAFLSIRRFLTSIL